MPGWLAHLLPPGLEAGTYAGMGLMVMMGACLQGVGGLGFAMFCAPVAALLFPELVPGPLLALGCPLALMAGLREWAAIDWPVAGAALVGRVAGTGLAAAALALLPVATLSLVFAGLILAGVALSLSGWRVAASRSSVGMAGLASGLMGTITSAGAPPFAIAMQNLAPATLRATLGCVFFIGSAISLGALAAVGRMNGAHLLLAVLLAPWMVAGFAISGPLAQRLSRRGLRHFLLALATFGALGVLAQSIMRH